MVAPETRKVLRRRRAGRFTSSPSQGLPLPPGESASPPARFATTCPVRLGPMPRPPPERPPRPETLWLPPYQPLGLPTTRMRRALLPQAAAPSAVSPRGWRVPLCLLLQPPRSDAVIGRIPPPSLPRFRRRTPRRGRGCLRSVGEAVLRLPRQLLILLRSRGRFLSPGFRRLACSWASPQGLRPVLPRARTPARPRRDAARTAGARRGACA